jgi:hypothetical protein
MMMNNVRSNIRRCAVLLTASFVSVVLFWIAYGSICEKIDSKLIGFEREPALGWDHWRWFFIKQDIGGVMRTLAVPIVLAVVVVWKWIVFARNIVRGSSLDQH